MSVYLFAIPFLVWVIVQLLKLCIDFYKTKKISFSNLWISWWFPSVHWALTSSVTTVIALNDWINSSLFALALVLSFLFWYDAMNVRYESWQHALYINKLRSELQDVLDDRKSSLLQLKERIGHTPFEVLWWIVFGVGLTVLIYYFL